MTEEHKDNTSHPRDNLKDVFESQRPVNSDELFMGLQDINICPEIESQYESVLVKVQKEFLQLANVVACLVDMTSEHTFQSLEIFAVAVVVETQPLILATCMRLLDERETLPQFILLKNTTSVFAFNSFGVKMLPQIFGDKINNISEKLLGVQAWVPPITPTPVNLNHTFPSFTPMFPAPSVPTTENSYKARKNQIDVQPIKLFFNHDAAKFSQLCGSLEDLSSSRTVANVQAKMPRTYLQFIALQSHNIPILLQLSFQLTISDTPDMKMKSLHLIHFRTPGSPYKLFYQVRQLFVNFTEIMYALAPDASVLRLSFGPLLEMLHSEQEGALKYCDPALVLNELSERLVNWTMVCSSVTAPSDSVETLILRLRGALFIDLVLVNNRNMLSLTQKMYKSLANPSDRTSLKRDRGDGQQPGGVKNKAFDGEKSYCLSQACVHFLGKGKVYDSKKPLSPCSYQSSCRFEHDFPNTPVSVTQKVKLLNLLTILKDDGKSPERLAALTKVMRQPTFSV